MGLTDGGKRFLAQYAGKASGTGYCFANSGVAFKDIEGVNHTGSTSDVLTVFALTAMIGQSANYTKVICNGKTYNDFLAANGSAPTVDDVTVVEAGEQSATLWCFTTPCTWVASKGGPSGLAFADLQTLVSMYLGSVTPLWTVKFSDLMGAVYYYLDMVADGNKFSGCSFS